MIMKVNEATGGEEQRAEGGNQLAQHVGQMHLKKERLPRMTLKAYPRRKGRLNATHLGIKEHIQVGTDGRSRSEIMVMGKARLQAQPITVQVMEQERQDGWQPDPRAR